MKPQSRKYRPAAILMALAIATAFILVGTAGYLGTAQAAPRQPQTAAAKVMHTDDLQRSARLDHYKLMADSGAARGENIYFFKCWMCHNKYAKTGPYLKSLYQHESMMSGDPVTDQNVIAKIKEGGPGMPRSKLPCPILISLIWRPMFGKENVASKGKIRRRIPCTSPRHRSGPSRVASRAAPKES